MRFIEKIWGGSRFSVPFIVMHHLAFDKVYNPGWCACYDLRSDRIVYSYDHKRVSPSDFWNTIKHELVHACANRLRNMCPHPYESENGNLSDFEDLLCGEWVVTGIPGSEFEILRDPGVPDSDDSLFACSLGFRHISWSGRFQCEMEHNIEPYYWVRSTRGDERELRSQLEHLEVDDSPIKGCSIDTGDRMEANHGN